MRGDALYGGHCRRSSHHQVVGGRGQGLCAKHVNAAGSVGYPRRLGPDRRRPRKIFFSKSDFAPYWTLGICYYAIVTNEPHIPNETRRAWIIGEPPTPGLVVTTCLWRFRGHNHWAGRQGLVTSDNSTPFVPQAADRNSRTYRRMNGVKSDKDYILCDADGDSYLTLPVRMHGSLGRSLKPLPGRFRSWPRLHTAASAAPFGHGRLRFRFVCAVARLAGTGWPPPIGRDRVSRGAACRRSRLVPWTCSIARVGARPSRTSDNVRYRPFADNASPPVAHLAAKPGEWPIAGLPPAGDGPARRAFVINPRLTAAGSAQKPRRVPPPFPPGQTRAGGGPQTPPRPGIFRRMT